MFRPKQVEIIRVCDHFLNMITRSTDLERKPLLMFIQPLNVFIYIFVFAKVLLGNVNIFVFPKKIYKYLIFIQSIIINLNETKMYNRNEC